MPSAGRFPQTDRDQSILASHAAFRLCTVAHADRPGAISETGAERYVMRGVAAPILRLPRHHHDVVDPFRQLASDRQLGLVRRNAALPELPAPGEQAILAFPRFCGHRRRDSLVFPGSRVRPSRVAARGFDKEPAQIHVPQLRDRTARRLLAGGAFRRNEPEEGRECAPPAEALEVVHLAKKRERSHPPYSVNARKPRHLVLQGGVRPHDSLYLAVYALQPLGRPFELGHLLLEGEGVLRAREHVAFGPRHERLGPSLFRDQRL